jgi:hypothetical protein
VAYAAAAAAYSRVEPTSKGEHVAHGRVLQGRDQILVLAADDQDLGQLGVEPQLRRHPHPAEAAKLGDELLADLGGGDGVALLVAPVEAERDESDLELRDVGADSMPLDLAGHPRGLGVP